MPRQGPHRVAPGRHTLGSPPESQEPLAPAVVVALPSLSPLDNLTDGAEPSHTIYGARWYAARERAHEARQRRGQSSALPPMGTPAQRHATYWARRAAW